MYEPKVVFATDLTGDVGAGLRLATRLAAERAATLVVLHVIHLDASDDEAMLHNALDHVGGRSERRLARLIPPDPSVPFLHALEAGEPEACIAAYVARERVELLVMEAPRRSIFARAFGRSLVERLIDRVSCPLVAYRPDNAPRGEPAFGPPLPLGATVPADALTTVLNARVDALLSWIRLRREAVLDVAGGRSVRDGIASLVRAKPHGAARSFAPRIRELLEFELREHQRALGAVGVEVATADGQPLLQLGLTARRDGSYARFLERLGRDGAAVSVPLDASSDLPSAPCVVVTGAMVPLHDLAVQLLFTLDARRDFLRILAQPGPVASAETYAFDNDGVMLSNSRFPDQLRRVGLLPPEPGVQTPRRIRVCDPGTNLLEGAVGPLPRCPLTRMAADATAGHDGFDFTGYRDYRGVEVVGAWRWLPEHGFGVAAEMDRLAAT